ncbi:MAG TPA: molybdate ABC transporter substrate-binding protein [Chthonomonadaceae bacterium]|nr:molybdate ABC transporter substrate-binding protein [Chthonomonadaceae bacterium]
MKQVYLRACLVAVLTILPVYSRADEILVSAAASLTDAFNEIGMAYTKANPKTTVRFNFGASGALQQQIMQGAPVDVFASASPKEMDALQQARRIEAATRADFAGNRLVLIAPVRSGIKRWEDLRLPAVRRVALSNPDSVPSGRYAQETLTKRGLWSVVQPKAILGENVRQTLTYVASGDVDAGIVFATDAQIEKQRVRVVQDAIPGRDHQPIVYPAAVIVGAPNGPAARRFVAFLHSRTAQAILARYGFTPAHPMPTRKRKKAPMTRIRRNRLDVKHP